jgi:hypothetical protein
LFIDKHLCCETQDPLARQLSCEIPAEDALQTFTLTAVNLDGTETAFSNSINFQ